MALQFDGSGSVSIPQWSEAGDFSIVIPSFTYESSESIGIIMSSSIGANNWIGYFTGGVLRLRVDNDTADVTGLIDGQEYSGHFYRVGTTITADITGLTPVSVEATGVFDIGVVGNYNGAFPQGYNGVIGGQIVMSGDNNNTRTYDFDQPVLSEILPDLTDGQDGTLSGFTSGGFLPFGDSVAITTLDGFPAVDYFCKQRDGNGQISLTVTGAYSGAATSIEYQAGVDAWQVLDANPVGGLFGGVVTITNQQDLSVRIGNIQEVTSTLEKISAAACIVVWWQSNAAGRGNNLQPITVRGDNPVPIMHNKTDFLVLADAVGTDGSAAGSVWPGVAQLYSDAGIPICIGNVAVGGTSITQWQPAGSNYLNIKAFHDACQGLEFSTSIGGETDSVNGMSTADMIANLTTTLTAINNDFGVNHRLTYFPVGSNTGTPTNVDNIRAGFDSVIENNSFVKFGGDLQGIDLTDGDNLHLKTDEDIAIAVPRLHNGYRSEPLTITTTGAPDGVYDSVMWDINGRNIAYNGAISVTGDEFTVNVVAPTGATIMGDAYDPLGADEDGFRLKGVTS